MEASILLKDINNISNSIGTRGGGNDNEDGLGEHYRDKVSPCADSVVHMSVSEAEKRLKKLERDYQHTYKSYLETRSNRYSSYIKRRHSNYNSGQAGNCIIYFKNLREKLQNDLEKLNKAEETQKRTDKPDYFSYTQSIVPKSSSSKGIHDLLRSLKDTKKLRNKGTASGELVDNQTSQDSLKTSIKVIKIGPFPHLFLTTLSSRKIELESVLLSLDLRVLTRPFCPHSIDESSLDRRVLTRPTSPHSTDESSLDRRVLTRPTSPHSTVLSSLRSTSPHSTDESSLDRRILTRPTSPHSTVLSSLGVEHSLASICAVAWLDLSRSLDSLPCGHSTRSLAVTRLAPSRSLDSLSRSHSARIALSQSLGSDRSLAVTRLGSLSRSHSARIALSQSLRLLASLEHDVIPRRHVHP
ncbi:hypothetical protein Bca4012_095225 [Brassica carinata]